MFDPLLLHRRSFRLKGYDYSKHGFYFITTLTEERSLIFGKITVDIIHLNDLGKIVENRWNRIPEFFKKVILHEFIIMPEHTHGIIEILGEDFNSTNTKIEELFEIRNLTDNFLDSGKVEFKSPSETIGSFVRGFKFGVMNDNKELTGKSTKIFERDYFEEIIKDYQAFKNITNYKRDNPKNYKKDRNKKGNASIIGRMKIRSAETLLKGENKGNISVSGE